MLSARETHSTLTPTIEKVPVLLVDDRQENLLAYKAALNDVNYDLATASSGEEALLMLRKDRFAAILLDVNMPGMNGFETARLIRRSESESVTPIIFVTAADRSQGIERVGYEAGAVDYLFKPLDPAILRAKVGVFADLYRKSLQISRQAERIKEQELKEQELRLLKRSIQARDEFLAIASHELNTPITPLSLQMQSFLRMIEKGTLATTSPERLTGMLKNSYSQVERLSRLIQELVDVTKLSSGRLWVEKGQVSLLETVRSVVEAFSEETKRLGCTVEIKSEGEPIGHWDRTRIEQIVVNLLSNALKYGRGQPITISMSASEVEARLEVSDRGIGIKAADQQRIFERFERAVSAENYGGLGLGLYITREIARLHGGDVAVESVPDHGSTFIVRLPLFEVSG